MAIARHEFMGIPLKVPWNWP